MVAAAERYRDNGLGVVWRCVFALVFALFATGAGANTAEAPTEAGFRTFVEELWPDAKAKGVSRTTFDAAFKGVTYNARLIANTNTQAEFVKPVWQYLATAVSPSRIERGRAKVEAQEGWLRKAREDFGVDTSTILGIWGMETEFGAFEGSDNVIRSLATLAYIRYRDDYFRDELLAALSILEEGDIGPSEMVGSWAGAMGQTQFMPSSFLQYAVDFDGAGRRDIWSNPADAIGSTANFLAKHGWTKGLPWGFEVRLPRGFKLTPEDSSRPATFVSFEKRGVSRVDGKAMPREGEAELLMPAGLKGVIFLVTNNFKVIKTYNNSTSYALGVSLLGDAITRSERLRASWPVRDGVLSMGQVRDLQTRLQQIGFEVGKVDGQVGDKLLAAVRAYQADKGAPPDGYPSLAVLKMVKAKH
jgi:membrane-bound lytic murein transglycosylase B